MQAQTAAIRTLRADKTEELRLCSKAMRFLRRRKISGRGSRRAPAAETGAAYRSNRAAERRILQIKILCAERKRKTAAKPLHRLGGNICPSRR